MSQAFPSWAAPLFTLALGMALQLARGQVPLFVGVLVPIVALIAGIFILVLPRLLNSALVALYLIVIGLIVPRHVRPPSRSTHE